MASLKDVARIANVSPRTVDRAIHGTGYVRADVRERILAVVQEVGYRPDPIARSLRMKKSFEIAIAVDSMDELYMASVAGLEETVRNQGYAVTISFYDGIHEDAFLSNLVQRRPAAVALRAGDYDILQAAKTLEFENIPYVIIDGRVPEMDGIKIDRPQGVYDAVRYLIAQGRKRIAYLGPKSNMTRISGYRRAMDEAGMKPSITDASDDPDTQFALARASASNLKDADAVQVYSDLMALGLLSGFHDIGVRIPDDVAVIGFDNRRAASLSWPTLTTVAQPSREIGIAAGRMLIGKIKEETAPPGGWSEVLPTRLVVRESA